MNNMIMVPLLIPLLTGIILILFKEEIKTQRVISVISMILLLIVNAMLLQQVHLEGIQTLELGNWRAPYGIVFVADTLAVLLVLTASIVGFACLLFSFFTIGEAREKSYFYAFFQFLLTGIFGAFLTGDIFNLFVFFEVMLISSYVLLVLGGTKGQFRESLKYVLINVISSALFVIAVGYLYAVTGTLNMAHLSERIAEVGQQNIITVIAILFFIVFGLKGAVFPLFFWLPGSYAAPPTAVSALFAALLTKVGVYSIYRTFTVIFYHEPSITHTLIAILAALTIIVGVIGAVAHYDIRKILIYNILTAVGVILFGIAMLSPDSLNGALFYLVHDMIIKGAIFLLGGAIIIVTGTSDIRKLGGLIHQYPLLGWLFFVTAISLAGIPPLSGFVGKMLIVRSGLQTEFFWIAVLVVLSSLLVFYSALRIFMRTFWGEANPDYKVKVVKKYHHLVLPGALLLMVSIAMGLGAEWLYPYIEQSNIGLLDPNVYIDAILKE
ncbi:Na+/H+ antiporter subunit D [Bacillus sp. HMF5848]|uniref:Na+/H+ antiporter subunit D n=1 Tax=Bacillus sp. HMF5848 TaxID=2495421 RepID=UPI000F77ACA5|nr:Na+/H+ antiporter subunit D [Bacillus sp. HMF5848]RSK28586.1 Na+/H+ antiporter subunit D [Bacillus sp. HMF5848]